MKKEPIIYFPNTVEERKNKKASVGQILRIGKPSKRHYEYLYHSLNYNSHTIEELQKLLKLEGLKVKIVSILKMSNGSEIAVLRKKDERPFLNDIEKIFSDLNKGLETKELNFI